MKIKIGDFVRFVDEDIEGHVTSIQANDIIGVTDESGFEIPVPVSKVTAVHGDMKRADDEEEQEDIKPAGVFVEKGVFIALSGEQREGLARFYVVNETSFRLLTAIAEVQQGGKNKGRLAAIIPPHSATEFYTANFSTIGKWPTFSFRIVKYSDTLHTQQPPVDDEIRIKAGILSETKRRHELLSEKAWLIPLDAEKKDIGLDRLKNFGKSF